VDASWSAAICRRKFLPSGSFSVGTVTSFQVVRLDAFAVAKLVREKFGGGMRLIFAERYCLAK
jgi:hypothetical protein